MNGKQNPTLALRKSLLLKIAQKEIFPRWGLIAEGIFRDQANQLVTIEGSGMMKSDTSSSESFDRHFSYGKSGVNSSYSKHNWALEDLAAASGDGSTSIYEGKTAQFFLLPQVTYLDEDGRQGTDPNAIRDGLTLISGGNTVQVVSAAGKTVIITKTPNKKSVTIPATVNVKGINCKVVGIKSGIFRKTKIRIITIKSKTLIKKRFRSFRK